MATLTISITAGTTVSNTLTYSTADAQRIMAAWQKMNNPSATPQDIVDFYARFIKNKLSQIVTTAETVLPTPLAFT